MARESVGGTWVRAGGVAQRDASALPADRPGEVARLREQACFLWSDRQWIRAARVMVAADRVERGGRTRKQAKRDLRLAEAKAAADAAGICDRGDQREFALDHRLLFSAGEIAAALGISRNVVIGWWHRGPVAPARPAAAGAERTR